jgi:3-isopropylmalate dehydratase small subunit
MNTGENNIKYIGKSVSLLGSNISVEQILPSVCIDFDEPSEFLFFNVRKKLQENVCKIDEKLFFDASIIVTGNNFGCNPGEDNSEIAAKALKDNGFNIIIAGKFGPNFIESCNICGIACIRLSIQDILNITKNITDNKDEEITIDFANSALWQSNETKIDFIIETDINLFKPSKKLKDYYNMSDFPLDLEYMQKLSDSSSPEAKLSKEFKEKYGTQGYLEILDSMQSKNTIDFSIGSMKMETVDNNFVVSFFKQIYSAPLTMLLKQSENSIMCDGPEGEVFVCLFTCKKNLSKWSQLNQDLSAVYSREMTVSIEMLFKHVMKDKEFGIHLNPDAGVFDLLICHDDVQFIKKSFFIKNESYGREMVRSFLGY